MVERIEGPEIQRQKFENCVRNSSDTKLAKERNSAKKMLAKCAEEMEQVRNEIAEREARFQELGRRIKKIFLAEEDLDEEIGVLQTEGEHTRQLCISIQRMLLRSGLGGAALHAGSRHTRGSRSKLFKKS